MGQEGQNLSQEGSLGPCYVTITALNYKENYMEEDLFTVCLPAGWSFGTVALPGPWG